MLVKLLECPEAQHFQRRMREAFASVKTVKASATRKGSTERYLLARGFRGPEAGSERDPGAGPGSGPGTAPEAAPDGAANQ
jgi:hypothetical protein